MVSGNVYNHFFNHFVFKMVAANAHHQCGALNLRSKQSRFYLYLWSDVTQIYFELRGHNWMLLAHRP